MLRKKGAEALARLITIAKRNTGQSKRVADFLLSWWNSTSGGGFDLTDFWSVDEEIADDMLAVIGLIRQTRAYKIPSGRRFMDTSRHWWRFSVRHCAPTVNLLSG